MDLHSAIASRSLSDVHVILESGTDRRITAEDLLHLAKWLHLGDKEERLGWTGVLGKIGGEGCQTILLRALDPAGPDRVLFWEARAEAARQLGRFAVPEVVDRLRRSMVEDRREVIAAASEGLAMIARACQQDTALSLAGLVADGIEPRLRSTVARALAVTTLDLQAIDALALARRAAQSADARVAALEALTGAEHPNAIAARTELRTDDTEAVSLGQVNGLAPISALPEAFAALRTLRRSGTLAVRCAALGALATSRHPDVTVALSELREDDADTVALAQVHFLRPLADLPEAFAALRTLRRRSERDNAGLDEPRDPFLDGPAPSFFTARPAGSWVQADRGQSCQTAWRGQSVRAAALEALAASGHQDAANVVAELCEGDSEHVALCQIGCLLQIADKSAAFTALRVLRRSQHQSVRAAALTALAELPYQEALDLLLARHADDDAATVEQQIALLQALSRPGSGATERCQAVASLLRVEQTRLAAATALCDPTLADKCFSEIAAAWSPGSACSTDEAWWSRLRDADWLRAMRSTTTADWELGRDWADECLDRYTPPLATLHLLAVALLIEPLMHATTDPDSKGPGLQQPLPWPEYRLWLERVAECHRGLLGPQATDPPVVLGRRLTLLVEFVQAVRLVSVTATPPGAAASELLPYLKDAATWAEQALVDSWGGPLPELETMHQALVLDLRREPDLFDRSCYAGDYLTAEGYRWPWLEFCDAHNSRSGWLAAARALLMNDWVFSKSRWVSVFDALVERAGRGTDYRALYFDVWLQRSEGDVFEFGEDRYDGYAEYSLHSGLFWGFEHVLEECPTGEAPVEELIAEAESRIDEDGFSDYTGLLGALLRHCTTDSRVALWQKSIAALTDWYEHWDDYDSRDCVSLISTAASSPPLFSWALDLLATHAEWGDFDPSQKAIKLRSEARKAIKALKPSTPTDRARWDQVRASLEVHILARNGALLKVVGGFTTWRGADLREADLRGADLREADLSGADLREADLRGADLREADLSGADLRKADLSDADLREADVSSADLRGANLIGTDLSGANLRKAALQGSCIDDATQLGPKWRRVWELVTQGSHRDLDSADLSDANLRGAELSGENLFGAHLSGANLCEANFSGTDLCQADLRNADLGGANMRYADLRDANMRGANLDGADLSEAKYNADTRWPDGFDPDAADADPWPDGFDPDV